jgi:hypothetical protein
METGRGHRDVEAVRALLGHKRIATTRLCLDQTGEPQTRSELLRNEGTLATKFQDVEHERVKHQRNQLGGPNGIWQWDVFPVVPFAGLAVAA